MGPKPKVAVHQTAGKLPGRGYVVKPIEICRRLGPERVSAFYSELSGKEVRDVLRAGGASASVPATVFSRAQRLKAWRKRFDAEFDKGNDRLAMALLVEWLMRHHREMLVDYLDHLGVEHKEGETDEDFCETKTPEELASGVEALLQKYPPEHVAVYMLLIGHLQESSVFDQNAKVLESLGMSADEATQYVETHRAAFPPAEANG